MCHQIQSDFTDNGNNSLTRSQIYLKIMTFQNQTLTVRILLTPPPRFHPCYQTRDAPILAQLFPGSSGGGVTQLGFPNLIISEPDKSKREHNPCSEHQYQIPTNDKVRLTYGASLMALPMVDTTKGRKYIPSEVPSAVQTTLGDTNVNINLATQRKFIVAGSISKKLRGNKGSHECRWIQCNTTKL